VGVPDAASRMLMVRRYLAGVSHTLSDDEVRSVSDDTVGWSGSEMKVSLFFDSCICLMISSVHYTNHNQTQLNSHLYSRYLN
jgi:hypothetical protein